MSNTGGSAVGARKGSYPPPPPPVTESSGDSGLPRESSLGDAGVPPSPPQPPPPPPPPPEPQELVVQLELVEFRQEPPPAAPDATDGAGATEAPKAEASAGGTVGGGTGGLVSSTSQPRLGGIEGIYPASELFLMLQMIDAEPLRLPAIATALPVEDVSGAITNRK